MAHLVSLDAEGRLVYDGLLSSQERATVDEILNALKEEIPQIETDLEDLYRKNVRKLPGCPDIVLPKYNTVIFVNGCFWHKHDCPRFVWPASNKDYWEPKILRNVERDKKNTELLIANGWKVIVVWECELKKAFKEERLAHLCTQIREGISGGTN